jgi:hypothetical protein
MVIQTVAGTLSSSDLGTAVLANPRALVLPKAGIDHRYAAAAAPTISVVSKPRKRKAAAADQVDSAQTTITATVAAAAKADAGTRVGADGADEADEKGSKGGPGSGPSSQGWKPQWMSNNKAGAGSASGDVVDD